MENQEVFTYFTGGPPPNWLESNSWYAPVKVAPAETMPLVGLKKLDLKVGMCCMKCAEIISEEIREVPGEHQSTTQIVRITEWEGLTTIQRKDG